MYLSSQLPRQSLCFDYQVYTYPYCQQQTQSDNQIVPMMDDGLLGMSVCADNAINEVTKK